MMRGEKLARPLHPYGNTTRKDGLRDPSPIWDAWYETFTPTDRRRLVAFTTPGGISPDQLAGELGVSVDDALLQWRRACLATPEVEIVVDVDEWEMADLRQTLSRLLGPQEVAQRLEVQANTVHQWCKRRASTRIPEPVRVVSGIPLWLDSDIDAWALETGRMAELATF
jgi:transposase-like protein